MWKKCGLVIVTHYSFSLVFGGGEGVNDHYLHANERDEKGSRG